MNDRLVISGGHPWHHDHQADVLIEGGRITAMASKLVDDGTTRLDGTGLVLLPGFVDTHSHLDKTLFGRPWQPHSARDELGDRIDNERRRRPELGLPDPRAMTQLVESMIAAGTTATRTHTDVFPDVGTAHVHAVREIAERHADRVDIQQVGFPQYGVTSTPGTADLLAELAADGSIAAVGGIDPAGIDHDPIGQLDAIFGIAAEHGVGVDIHLHDPGSLGIWQIEAICRHSNRFGLAGRVVISHAYCLGQVDPSTQQRLAEMLAQAGVHLVTAAVYDYPLPPIETMVAAGVNVAVGNDGIRDLWGPYGDGDMLRRAMLVAYRSGFRRDDQLRLALLAATTNGAAVLDDAPHGLDVGMPADIVAVGADNAAHAIVDPPVRSFVMKRGTIVARDGAVIDSSI